MNILVTGGLGHIGSKLIREYAKRPDIELIRILDNLSTQRYSSLFNLSNNKRYEFIEEDINSPNLKKAMSDIDIVIHLAAITDAPSTINNPKETHKVNFIGTKNVLEASLKSDVKKFLYASTTSVYGEAEGLIDESYAQNKYKPSSPYAESKLKAENLVRKIAKENNFNANVLRKGTIFGTSIGMRFHTAVNKFCYLAINNKPLTVWENVLEQKRPYLGLYDAIKAYAFLEKKGKSGELYNVLTANFTLQEIINTIKKFIPELKIQMTKSPILNQKSYEVSDEKLRSLGFKPQDSLEGGIKATLDLFKAIKIYKQ